MKKLLAAFALSSALAVGLAPSLALAADTDLANETVSATQTLTTQASDTPTITVTRATTGKIAVKVGKTYKLGAKTTAGKLTYKSSRKKVARVSSKGSVKAVKAGKTTITVTAKNGSKKATKKITVKVLSAKKYKRVKKVMAKASATSLEAGQTATVKATFKPSKASNKNVTYKSSDSKVLTIDASGKMKAVKAGTAKVTVTSCDNAKAKASVTITVKSRIPDISEVSPKAALEKYSWTELKAISNAIAAAANDEAGLDIAKTYNLVDADGKLDGATKRITLTYDVDIKTPANVRILGFRHDNKASGGKAGISFEFSDTVYSQPINSHLTNVGGWAACEMRSWLNSEFLSRLPDDLRRCIVSASKKTNNRGGSTNYDRDLDNTSIVTTTSDKVWLLSMVELYGTFADYDTDRLRSPATYNAEGSQYKLYSDWEVSPAQWTNWDRCCKTGSEWDCWYLRSPALEYANAISWYRIEYNGKWLARDAFKEGGVSPGFCF